MSKALERADLPDIDDLPIPKDTRVTRRWTGQMIEMAAHIGAYDTLRIIDAYGGQRIYVPRDPEASPFREIIDRQRVAKLAWVYAYETLWIPTGKSALFEARRGGVLAMVRAGELGKREAAVILKTARAYLNHLLSRPDDEWTPPEKLKRSLVDDRQITIFDVIDRD